MHIDVILLVLLGTWWTVNSKTHSLRYIYTALSKPMDLPGIHEFTALGTLDKGMIDYYDSTQRIKIPKKDWMKDNLMADYWEKGTDSRKSKEQWFKVNIKILMERMRQNNSDVHIFQWQHGCEIEDQPDGSSKFLRGFDQYSYDGGDFLAFDDDTKQWVAPNDYAVPTKKKWDGEEMLNNYTKGYLEKECVSWLNTFKHYCMESVRNRCLNSPPKVFLYAKKSLKAGHIKLTCWATDFIPKEITLEIRKNKIPIKQGVHSSGIRPNHDDTHQMWKRIEILEDDKANYDCYVHHEALHKPITKEWDQTCADIPASNGRGSIGIAIAIVLVILIGVTGLIFYFYRKHKCFGQKEPIPPAKTDVLLEGDTEGNETVNVFEDDSGRGSSETLPSYCSKRIDEDSEKDRLPSDAV